MFKVILKPFNNLPLGPVWEASAFIMCFSLVSFNLSPICTFPSGCETEWAWRRFYSCLHHRAITSYVFEQRLGRLISLHLFTSTLMRAYRNSLMHLMTCSGSSVGLRLPPFLACYCKFYSAPPPSFTLWECVGLCRVLYCTSGSAAGHCRAPMDCSMPFSLPLSSRAATSLPPPTHSSPMNTRGTCDRIKTEQECNWFGCSRWFAVGFGDTTINTTRRDTFVCRTRVTIPLTSLSCVHINEQNRINFILIFQSGTIFFQYIFCTFHYIRYIYMAV